MLTSTRTGGGLRRENEVTYTIKTRPEGQPIPEQVQQVYSNLLEKCGDAVYAGISIDTAYPPDQRTAYVIFVRTPDGWVRHTFRPVAVAVTPPVQPETVYQLLWSKPINFDD